MGYLYIAGTLALASYSQVVVKWRTDHAGAFPDDFGDKLEYLARLVFSPWVISAGIAVLLAALLWVAALTQLDLSRAYPFMGATFVLVLLFSALFFSEPLTAPKVIGTAVIVVGIAIATRP